MYVLSNPKYCNTNQAYLFVFIGLLINLSAYLTLSITFLTIGRINLEAKLNDVSIDKESLPDIMENKEQKTAYYYYILINFI